MKVFCNQRFIDTYHKLLRKKQYNDLESLILGFFCDKNFEVVATGDRLYGPNNIPYLKKRLPDSGGYRFYFLADFEKEIVYINYLHPKTGSEGKPNIDIALKKELHDEILVDRKSNQNLFELVRCSTTKELLFI